MDNPARSAPAKKKCILPNRHRAQPVQHVRDLQSSGRAKPTLASGASRPAASAVAHGDAARTSSNAENKVPYNLHKLRILSPRGRDLGEFSVKLQSTDPSKGNTTIMITKSVSKPTDKPLTLPLSPVLHARATSRILKPGAAKFPRCNLLKTMSCGRSDSRTGSADVLHQSQFTASSKIMNSRGTEGKMDRQTYNCNSINVAKARSTGGVSSKLSLLRHTVNSDNHKDVKCYVIDDDDNADTRNCTKIVQETTAKSKNSTAVPSTPEILEFSPNHSKRSATMNSSNRDNGSLAWMSKGKCIAVIKNTENGKIVTSLKSASNLKQTCNQNDRHSNQKSLRYSSKRGNDEISYDRNSPLVTLSLTSNVVPKATPEVRNVMTVIPNNNKPLSFNQNAVVAQECNTPLAEADIKNTMHTKVVDRGAVRHDRKTDSAQGEGSKAGSQNNCLVVNNYCRRVNNCQYPRVPESQQIRNAGANAHSGAHSKERIKDLQQKRMAQVRLNIIKKAMNSVKDNALRELALKALADCGIGMEKYVPMRPKDYKAVHDTQVQTAVFGLLDPKSFILINKDLDDIHRLNQITLRDDRPNDEAGRLPADNLPSNDLGSNDLDVLGQEDPFDLDSFLEQFWKEDSDALKMKETLSMTRVRCNNLLENLQRDFERVKQYDENGMLNIHNAVVSDSISLVQRQLMVLKHCNQNVDVFTEDGMTSLELAIKYGMRSEIVKLLLDAGAQPAIWKPVHETAVIIASKQSSPLLPSLISRVSDSKLLDQIDSEGFAAIHYCSIHGNLQGIKALLSAGASVDLKDMKSGRTSLFHAIDNSHKLVMKALLKAGAVVSIANYAGQIPMAVICDREKSEFEINEKR